MANERKILILNISSLVSFNRSFNCFLFDADKSLQEIYVPQLALDFIVKLPDYFIFDIKANGDLFILVVFILQET